MEADVALAAWVTLAVIVLALVLMMLDVASPDVVLLSSVVGLAAVGIITPAQALAGFANHGMLAVAALFVVAAGLRQTGAIGLVTGRMLGRPTSAGGALARMVPPVMLASAFLNNTTIVAAMLPAIHDWGRRIGVPASRLLLPLSYATIVGGLITLIGTSTNLVVAGLVHDALPDTPGLRELGMFDHAPVGALLAGLTGAVMVLLGPVLLPDRTPAVSLADDPRRYTIELLVPAQSRLVGQTIEEAGLRHLPGAFLLELVRADHVVPAVAGTEVLQAHDHLVFAGDVDAMVDLQRLPGLAAAPDQVFALESQRHERVLAEAVVSHRNPLVGQTIRDAQFRKVYHAAVIAVAHAGERVPGRIGDVVLHAGDVLLLETTPDFVASRRLASDFYLVSEIDGAAPLRTERAGAAFAILAVFVATVSLGLVSAVVGSFLAAGAMVAARCATLSEARRSLDLSVLIAIASAFGLGEAMTSTGLDAEIGAVAVAIGGGNPLAAMVAVYIATSILTELVTNNAAAALALPLGLSVAVHLGVSPMPYVYAVMFAASASFLTPIGYQTNLMVYGPGGYRGADYLRLGVPVALATAAVAWTCIPWWWPFTP